MILTIEKARLHLTNTSSLWILEEQPRTAQQPISAVGVRGWRVEANFFTRWQEDLNSIRREGKEDAWTLSESGLITSRPKELQDGRDTRTHRQPTSLSSQERNSKERTRPPQPSLTRLLVCRNDAIRNTSTVMPP